MKFKKSNADIGNDWKLKGAIIAFLVLFVFFVPIPKLVSLIFIWIVLILLCHILSGCWYFSAFISTTFIAILFIFLIIKSRQDNLEFKQAFIENFSELERGNLPMLVGENLNKAEPSDKLDKPNQQEIKAELPLPPLANNPSPSNKIPMMDNLGEIDATFGQLDTGEYEDSDEDTDDNEDELDKKVGKTTVSSKQAYKAQKQLYDLTTAVGKLKDNMDSLAPSLKKGQKIIESINSMGLKFT